MSIINSSVECTSEKRYALYHCQARLDDTETPLHSQNFKTFQRLDSGVWRHSFDVLSVACDPRFSESSDEASTELNGDDDVGSG